MKLSKAAQRVLTDIAVGNTRVFYCVEGVPYGWKELVRKELVGRELKGGDGGNDLAFLTDKGKEVALDLLQQFERE